MSKAIRYFDQSRTFFDGSSIAAGYYLFQYQAGTSTKADTYTDAGKGTANANPMTLDGDGRLGQDVYIDQSMKFVLAASTAGDPPTSSVLTIDNAVSNAQVWATSSKTVDYIALETDRDKLIKADASSGTLTVTLLAAATAGDGFRIAIKKVDSGSNTVVIDGNAAETIDGNATYTLRNQNEAILIVSDGSNWQAYNSSSSGVIYDANGNEEIIFTATGSAVNEITIANAATGNDPSITASGDNTNVGLDIAAKGTGTVGITGAALEVDNGATGAGELRLLEDSDNGTNYMGLKSPAAVTASLSLELPDGDGTSGDYLSTNASGVLAWSTPVAQSTQAAVEAETNEDTYVPPDLVKNNPGVAKFWTVFDGTAVTITSAASYNVTSLTDNGTGDYTVTIATDFSSANWSCGISFGPSYTNTGGCTITAQAAGTVQVKIIDNTSAADKSIVCVQGWGDQ